MKDGRKLIVALALAALAACGGNDDKCKCGPMQVCVDGKCVPIGDGRVDGMDSGGDDGSVSPDGNEGTVDDDGGGGDAAPDPFDEEGVQPDGGDATGEDAEEEEACATPCETEAQCDDSNPCTEDWCAPITKCCVWFSETLNYVPCGDDLFCNGYDYCLSGTCTHEDPNCSGDSECSIRTCDEVNDVCTSTPRPDGTPCDNGLFCDGTDNVCDDGYCQYRWPCPATTGNSCTTYACYEAEPHCREEAKLDGDPCPDANACNGYEFCAAGSCSKRIPACFDGDPCTQDTCVEATGDCVVPAPPIADCTNCAGDPACDDADPCTTDYCKIVATVKSCEHIYVPRCAP